MVEKKKVVPKEEKASKSMKKNNMKSFVLKLLWSKGFVFVFGIIFAVVVSLLNVYGKFDETFSKLLVMILIILGLVIGYKNIEKKEVIGFLVSMLVIVLLFPWFLQTTTAVLGISQNTVLGSLLNQFSSNLSIILIPAAIFVALRRIFVSALD